MRVTLIHNPGAGEEEGSGETLLHRIAAAGHDVRHASIRDDAWEDALDEPADLVAVAGGDGTVGPVVLRVRDRGVPQLQAVLDHAAQPATHRVALRTAQALDLLDQVAPIDLGVRPHLGGAAQGVRLPLGPGLEVVPVQVEGAASHRLLRRPRIRCPCPRVTPPCGSPRSRCRRGPP